MCLVQFVYVWRLSAVQALEKGVGAPKNSEIFPTIEVRQINLLYQTAEFYTDCFFDPARLRLPR